VHGLVFECLPFGVNGGVVHGLGFESLTFGGQCELEQMEKPTFDAVFA
jgi:hypothetical protein